MSTDPLADVFQAVRLRDAVFYSVVAALPWAIEASVASELVPSLMPEVDHLVEYHVVVRGRVWGGLIGQPPVELQAGDAFVFPHGDAHVLSTAPGMRSNPDPELHRNSRNQPMPIVVDQSGGRPSDVHVVCGFLGCDGRLFNPLLGTLPHVIRLEGGSTDGVWASELARVALSEAVQRRDGGHAVLARLSELMFIEAVRAHLRSIKDGHPGWLAGLLAPLVGKARPPRGGVDAGTPGQGRRGVPVCPGGAGHEGRWSSADPVPRPVAHAARLGQPAGRLSEGGRLSPGEVAPAERLTWAAPAPKGRASRLDVGAPLL